MVFSAQSRRAEMAEDGIMKWALSQKAFLERGIELLKTGKMFTAELRDGERVDTTAETIKERTDMLASLNHFLDRRGV
jgi:hypothetical protein